MRRPAATNTMVEPATTSGTRSRLLPGGGQRQERGARGSAGPRGASGAQTRVSSVRGPTRRPEGNENRPLPTGEIEVTASELEVLSESAPLPFQIDDRVEVGEEARLRHRYLDLRRPGPAAAIRLRSEVNRAAREVLAERRF